MTEKSLLFVPMFVLMTTAYVACSDDSGDYITPKQSYIDGGFGTLVDVKGNEVSWPDVADAEEEEDADDAPVSGGG